MSAAISGVAGGLGKHWNHKRILAVSTSHPIGRFSNCCRRHSQWHHISDSTKLLTRLGAPLTDVLTARTFQQISADRRHHRRGRIPPRIRKIVPINIKIYSTFRNNNNNSGDVVVLSFGRSSSCYSNNTSRWLDLCISCSKYLTSTLSDCLNNTLMTIPVKILFVRWSRMHRWKAALVAGRPKRSALWICAGRLTKTTTSDQPLPISVYAYNVIECSMFITICCCSMIQCIILRFTLITTTGSLGDYSNYCLT